MVGTAFGEDYETCDGTSPSSPRSIGTTSTSSGGRRRSSILDCACCPCCRRWCRFSLRTFQCYCCKYVFPWTLVKCGACCWLVILLAVTIFMPVFWYFLYGNQGSNSWNQDLINNLLNYETDGLRFRDICRFKQWTGTQKIDNPNLVGMIHHEGVMLNVATEDGFRKGFLQLDYGHFGTIWNVHVDWKPIRLYGKKHMDWGDDRGHIPFSFYSRGQHMFTAGCEYECGRIPLQQRPGGLVRMFEAYRAWRYNVFWFNCYDFAHLVWNWTQPDDVRCMNASAMSLRFGAQHA